VHFVSHNAGSLWTQFITFLSVKSSFFIAFFSLNFVTVNTNNKIHYENLASTGSLAGSKRVIFLYFICLARAQTNEPAANSRFATRFSTKKVESVSKACRKPARTCRKPGCESGRKPGLQPGLQRARIMKCGLNMSTAVMCGNGNQM